MGGLKVTVAVNNCPSLLFLYVAPSTLTVGESARFAAAVSDPDGDSVDQYWTATGARLSKAGGSGTWDTFTCLLPGTQTLTLWYFDSRGCSRDETIEVECLRRPDDLGG